MHPHRGSRRSYRAGGVPHQFAGYQGAQLFVADSDRDATLDFLDNASGSNLNNGIYRLGDADTLFDGIVIVKTPAPVLPVTPLVIFGV